MHNLVCPPYIFFFQRTVSRGLSQENIGVRGRGQGRGRGRITDRNTPQSENTANNEEDVSDIDSDAEDKMVDNKQPYYI